MTDKITLDRSVLEQPDPVTSCHQLADKLQYQVEFGSYSWDRAESLMLEAAAELRRLHFENARMLAALRLARNFVSDSVRSLVETEISPVTGMIESPEALMQIESEQDLLAQIEAAIEQATGGKA